MTEGGAVDVVLNGGFEQKEEEEKKDEEEEEEETGGPRKKRRLGEKEVTMVSDMRYAIQKVLLVCKGADENRVSTTAFLSVSNLLLLSLDKIGPTMAVLRQDVQRNIKRLEDLYGLNPPLYSNLVEVLKKEVDDRTAKKRDSCSRAVVWLSRSISFGLDLMEKLTVDEESTLEEAVEEAYNNNLKPWHGWISSAAYKVALKLIPDRRNFTELLMGEGQDYNLLKNDLEMFSSILNPFLKEIHSHLRTLQMDKYRSS